MSEKQQSPMYTRENHPHTDDPRVDPLAWMLRKIQGRKPLANPQDQVISTDTDTLFEDSDFVDSSNLVQKSNLEQKHVSSSYKIEWNPDKKIPYRYVSVKGKFFTGAPGSGVGAFAGELNGSVGIASKGKKLVKVYNGFPSVNGTIIRVKDPRDRQYLGKTYWWEWEKESISDETPKRRRVKKPTA